MSTTGASAAVTVSSVIGQPVGDPLREVDLAIDAAGDLMNIDAAGHHMIVQATVTWAGQSASQEV